MNIESYFTTLTDHRDIQKISHLLTHIQGYPNEFCYRNNRRNDLKKTAFHKLIDRMLKRKAIHHKDFAF